MKILELKDEAGKVFAFEVENLRLSRRRVRKIVSSIEGARELSFFPRWFFDADERVCEFELGTVKFLVMEPFGDSDRFWVGPDPVHSTPLIEKVRSAFENA